MRRVHRRVAVALTVVLVAMAAAASGALGATRYVAVGGSGTACTQAAPCGFVTGVTSAASGDEVIVAAGTYGSTGSPVQTALLSVPVNVTVRGAVIGPGRPVVHLANGLRLQSGVLVQDIQIHATDGNGVRVETGGHADRVVGLRTGAAIDDGCAVFGSGEISNSLCQRAELAQGSGLSLQDNGSSARNVTAVGVGIAIFQNALPGSETVASSNSIASGAGLDLDGLNSASVHTNLYYEDSDSLPATVFVNPVTSGLVFRNAAGGDFRQGAASTTIDAGDPASVLPGELDLNGNLRIIGAAPDIGAYEHVTSLGLGAVPSTSIAATTATLTPTVTTGGGRTTLTVSYGTSPGVRPNSASVAVPAAVGSSTPSITLTGLTPETTYYYVITVVNDYAPAGISNAELSFKTINTPTATVGVPSAVTATSATLNGTVDTKGGAGSFRFEVTPFGGGTTLSTGDQPLVAAEGSRAVSAGITGLAPGTSYDVVLKVTNNASTTTSATGSLLTLTASAVTDPATSVTTTSATLNGTVDTGGPAGSVRFAYTPTAGGTTVLTNPQALSAAVGVRAVTADVTGLQPFTSYDVEVRLTTEAPQSVTSIPVPFVTPAAAASAVTDAATSLTATSATLNGSVETGGAPGSVRFAYTPTSGGATVLTDPQALSAAVGVRAVTADVTGLQPFTSYDVEVRLTTDAPASITSIPVPFVTPAAAASAVTDAATSLAPASATLNGTVDTGGPAGSVRFAYAPTSGGAIVLTDPQALTAALGPRAVTADVTGLQPFTSYDVEVRLTTDTPESVTSAPVAFVTPAADAAAVTGAVTDLTTTSATLSGTVDTGGAPGEVRFSIAPAGGGAPTLTPAQPLAAANGPRVVTAAVTGLQPSTGYTVTVVLQTSVDTATGAPVGFTTATPPPAPPAPSAGAPPTSSEVGPDSAVVTGTVDTLGLGGTVHFVVTPVAGGPAITTPEQVLPPGSGPRPIGALVTDLRPGTEYRVELVVVTAGGTTRTPAGTFTTLPDVRKPSITIRVPASVRITRTTVLIPRVTCSEPCTLTVTARLGVRGGRPARFRLLPGARITLRLTPVTRTAVADTDVRLVLTRARAAALTALRAGRRVVVRIQIRAVDASGNARTVTRFVTLRLR